MKNFYFASTCLLLFYFSMSSALSQDVVEVVYMVKARDNLYKTMIKHPGSSLETITDRNRLDPPKYLIYPGQKLWIPIKMPPVEPIGESKPKTKRGLPFVTPSFIPGVLSQMHLECAQGLEERRAKTAERIANNTSSKKNLHLLSLGVGTIRDVNVKKLRLVDSSSIKLGRCFEVQEGVVFDTVFSKVIIGALTEADIDSIVQHFMRNIKDPEALIVIYLGGHGQLDINSKAYFCPFDFYQKETAVNPKTDTLISPIAFYEWINKKPKGQGLIALVDICYAQKFALPIVSQTTKDTTNISVIAGCSEYELSWEGSVVNNSSLVLALEMILYNQTSHLGFDPFWEGLTDELSLLVPIISKKMVRNGEGQQHPWIFRNMSQSIRFH